MIGINNQSKTVVILPESAWQEVRDTLQEVKDFMREKTETEINNKWVESTEARKILHVSQKTWQDYRDKRLIPFSQFGRKIYVRRADLEAFMEKHLITKE